MIGKVIDGRYKILSLLGEGGMARVFKAEHIKLEKLLAIKIIKLDAIPAQDHERIIERFNREARSLAALSSVDGIIKIHDFGEADKTPFFVMDYIHGGTLKDRLGLKISPNDAARMLLPIAKALREAHSKGLIHRDVKPSNILIDDDGKLYLSDFGIAKSIEDHEFTLTGTGLGVGTAAYMSPEQWRGKPGKGSDVFSLGVVFYEMITGAKPFEAETPSDLYLKMMTEEFKDPYPLIGDLPDSVQNLLSHSLQRTEQDRWDMERFVLGLEQIRSVPDGTSDFAFPIRFQNESQNTLDQHMAPTQSVGKKKIPWWIIAIISLFILISIFTLNIDTIGNLFGNPTEQLTAISQNSTQTPIPSIVVDNTPTKKEETITPTIFLDGRVLKLDTITGIAYGVDDQHRKILITNDVSLEDFLSYEVEQGGYLCIQVLYQNSEESMIHIFENSTISILEGEEENIQLFDGTVLIETSGDFGKITLPDYDNLQATVSGSKLMVSVNDDLVEFLCLEGLCSVKSTDEEVNVLIDENFQLIFDGITAQFGERQGISEEDFLDYLQYCQSCFLNQGAGTSTATLDVTPTEEQSTNTAIVRQTIAPTNTPYRTSTFKPTKTSFPSPTSTKTPVPTSTITRTLGPSPTSWITKTYTPEPTSTREPPPTPEPSPTPD